MLVEAAKAGRLATRGNSSKYRNSFKDMVEGINATLDAVIGPLNVAAEYVDRISKGDIPPRINDNYNGDFNEIKNNLNVLIAAQETITNVSDQIAQGNMDVEITPRSSQDQLMLALKNMVNTLNGLLDDMNNMSREHDLGDIDVIIPADKYQGAFNTMATGINTMVNGHINVKKKAMACIAEFGKGNFEAPLEQFPGKKAFINNTIEQVRSNLKALIADVNILSQASVEGKLATRADALKHEGDFRRIVHGINDTLDAVIGPLNVAAEYVDRISKGDVPARIVDDYKGDFNEIKTNLNVLIDAMNLMTETAQQIAQGDLTVEVHERSHQDQLMKALAAMVANLREIVGNVGSSSGSIATATKQIATGNADLAQRTETQASSLEEIASSMEELTSTVKQNADNSQQANQLAIDASDVAVKGGTVITRVVDTMESISASSKKIADIISVIDGIAFQTNILALNAAVEAARAGEQGRGFAVVAGEVRNLAQRSAAAAKEIKELISDSVDKVGNGSKLVGEAGQTMQEIVTSIKRVTDIMSEISAASLEQSSGIEQVNTAITSMDEITQQNASVVQEASSAAAALEEQAQLLVEAVNRFKLDESRKGQQREVARVQKQEPLITQAHAASKVGKHAKPGSTVPKANGYHHTTAPIAKAVGQDGDWNEF